MSEWIEHDGKGLPVPRGTPVETERRNGSIESGIAGSSPHLDKRGFVNLWRWIDRPHKPRDILRYRIRRPRAMETIDRILADVPERETA